MDIPGRPNFFFFLLFFFFKKKRETEELVRVKVEVGGRTSRSRETVIRMQCMREE